MLNKKMAVSALAVATAVVGLAPASGAAKATKAGRHVVDTTRLSVYEQPAKSYEGVLFEDESFEVIKLSSSGKYAYGMAYGHVNKKGWVDASALKRK